MSLIANNPKRRVNPMFQVEQSAAKQQQAQYDSYMYQMNNGQMNNGQMNNGQMNNGQMNNGQMNNGQIINGQMHHAQQYNQNNNTITPRSTGPIMPGMSQYRTCICPKLKPSQNDARCTCFRPH